jgi:hypothetical protein
LLALHQDRSNGILPNMPEVVEDGSSKDQTGLMRSTFVQTIKEIRFPVIALASNDGRRLETDVIREGSCPDCFEAMPIEPS